LESSDPTATIAEARAVYDKGVRVLKIKIGRNFADDLARIQRLQAEFKSSERWLYGDADEGLSPDRARAQFRQLADHGLMYIEEPLPIELVPERARLRKTEILPVIASDSALTVRDLNRELRFNTFDILNIDPARTGYHHSKEMLAAAKQHSKGVLVGTQTNSTLGTIRAAIFAGLEGIEYPTELSFFLKLADDIVDQPIQIRDGYINLDQLAAISVDEQRLKSFTI
jgi:L-alanine-DL-glutamate epimerase-like enolase superfamily enzyme